MPFKTGNIRTHKKKQWWEMNGNYRMRGNEQKWRHHECKYIKEQTSRNLTKSMRKERVEMSHDDTWNAGFYRKS